MPVTPWICTSTMPGVAPGVRHVALLLVCTITAEPRTSPNEHRRRWASRSPDPITVTVLPPAVGPELGTSPITCTSADTKNPMCCWLKSTPFELRSRTVLPGRCAAVRHSTMLDVRHPAGTAFDAPRRHTKLPSCSIPLPLTVTTVPPCSGPWLGCTPTICISLVYKNCTSAPPGCSPSTSSHACTATPPRASEAGACSFMSVLVSTATRSDRTSSEPNMQPLTPSFSAVPVISTVVPPSMLPELGQIADSSAGCTYMKLVLPLLASTPPKPVVSRSATVHSPSAAAGEMHSAVPLLTAMLATGGMCPKMHCTPLPIGSRPPHSTMMRVPPFTGPELGTALMCECSVPRYQ